MKRLRSRHKKMEDRKIKHLEMIENVIQRMADNSFKLKGWAVALIGLLSVFFSSAKNIHFLLAIIILILAFWYMDSYYLQLEKKYRVLYRNVCETPDSDVDFNMDISKIQMSDKEKEQIMRRKCIMADCEMQFYGPILLVVLGMQFLL